MSRRPRSFWEQLVADYAKSEQTQQAFCEERGVSLSTFQYWLYRLRRKDDSPSSSSGFDADDVSMWTAIYDSTPVAVSVIDRGHRLVAANAKFRDLFGQWEGLHCFEVLKREHRPCKRCGSARAFADGKVHVGEEEGFDRQGRRVYYEVTAAPLRRDNGEEVDYVLEMCVDISPLKQLERQYETLFQRTPCYTAVVDREMTVVDANLRYQERFGDPRGKSCHELFARRPGPCKECPAKQSFVDGRVHVQTIIGAGNAPLLVHAAPLLSADGEIMQVLEMAIDVPPAESDS